MTIFDALNVLGAILTILFGLLGLLFPRKASELTGLQAPTKAAFAEFRGTFGGAFVAIGVVPLILGSPAGFLVSASCWWGAAIGRGVSMVVDKGYRDSKNLAGLVLEGVIGLLLVVGNLPGQP